jgi:hypothetical protein
VLHSTPLKPCADSDMPGGPGMPSTALYTVLFLLAGFSDGGWIPILSDHMATGSLQANQTRCYRFHMDDATTKQAVNWEQRRKAPTAPYFPSCRNRLTRCTLWQTADPPGPVLGTSTSKGVSVWLPIRGPPGDLGIHG